MRSNSLCERALLSLQRNNALHILKTNISLHMVRFSSYNTGTLVSITLLINAQKSVMALLHLLLDALKAASTHTLSATNFEYRQNQTNLTRVSAQPTTCISRTMNSAGQIATDKNELWRKNSIFWLTKLVLVLNHWEISMKKSKL